MYIREGLYEILKSKGINLTKLDFTTQDAVRIFRRLGFEIVVKGKKKKALDDFVGVIKEGDSFNAVMEQFNCALSFVDTVLLKEAKGLKANILTFDYKLQNLAKTVLS